MGFQLWDWTILLVCCLEPHTRIQSPFPFTNCKHGRQQIILLLELVWARCRWREIGRVFPDSLSYFKFCRLTNIFWQVVLRHDQGRRNQLSGCVRHCLFWLVACLLCVWDRDVYEGPSIPPRIPEPHFCFLKRQCHSFQGAVRGQHMFVNNFPLKICCVHIIWCSCVGIYCQGNCSVG